MPDLDLHNPYSPPVVGAEVGADAPVTSESSVEELEEIRKEHFFVETLIRAVAVVCLMVAVAMGCFALFMPLLALSIGAHLVVLIGTVALGMGALYFLSGRWLRRFENRGRVMTSCVYGLAIVVAIGQVVMGSPMDFQFFYSCGLSGGIIALLWSRQAHVLFGEHFRTEVLPGTPHIKPGGQTAIIIIAFFLGALILKFALGGPIVPAG